MVLRLNIKKLCSVFPFLFIFELFFGYSGKMIVVGNIAIRQFLFAGTFFSLYAYCAYLMFLSLNKRKNNFDKFTSIFLTKVCLLDISFFLVLLSTIFFSTIIPFFSSTNLTMARNEVFSFILMLTLSFPIFYLIKMREINFKAFYKYIYYLVLVLSVLHIFLYVGQDFDKNFIYKYFFFLNTVLGRTSVFPVIMLGHAGVPRVFFTTSIFLPIGMYFSLKKIKSFSFFDHIYLAINTVAIICTMTKSLWLGTILGIVSYTVFNFFRLHKTGSLDFNKKIFIFVLEIFSFVCISNYTIFNDRVFHHLKNSFVYEQNAINGSNDTVDEELQDKIKEKFKNNMNAYHDREGSLISNNIKIKQIQLLLRKWIKKPVLGYGYGSYLENFLRSKEAPYSYEMVFFALLMKIGILGVLFWIFLIFSLFYMKYKYGKKKDPEDFSCWLFLIISFGLMVQTNPLLFNSVGMAFLLFIAIDSLRPFAECSLKNRKYAFFKKYKGLNKCTEKENLC